MLQDFFCPRLVAVHVLAVIEKAVDPVSVAASERVAVPPAFVKTIGLEAVVAASMVPKFTRAGLDVSEGGLAPDANGAQSATRKSAAPRTVSRIFVIRTSHPLPMRRPPQGGRQAGRSSHSVGGSQAPSGMGGVSFSRRSGGVARVPGSHGTTPLRHVPLRLAPRRITEIWDLLEGPNRSGDEPYRSLGCWGGSLDQSGIRERSTVTRTRPRAGSGRRSSTRAGSW